jgi:hypothetical protein
MTAALVLLLAACTTAGGDTTTTAPLAELSTTSTTAPSTTTTEPATTTTEGECVDRDGDGVLRNSRGFVCPPTLVVLSIEPMRGPEPTWHLPGTYETRQFEPRLRFARDTRFVTVGETANWLVFETDFTGDEEIAIFSGELGSQLAELPNLVPIVKPDDWEWATEVETTEGEIGGHSATVTMFTANCRDETTPEDDRDECEFTIPAAGDGYWYNAHGDRLALITLDTPEPVTLIVGTNGRAFDSYWAEVAQPIFDSIEFLDP